jgi:hypothetical protein
VQQPLGNVRVIQPNNDQRTHLTNESVPIGIFPTYTDNQKDWNSEPSRPHRKLNDVFNSHLATIVPVDKLPGRITLLWTIHLLERYTKAK